MATTPNYLPPKRWGRRASSRRPFGHDENQTQQPLERQRKRGSEVFIQFPHPTIWTRFTRFPQKIAPTTQKKGASWYNTQLSPTKHRQCTPGISREMVFNNHQIRQAWRPQTIQPDDNSSKKKVVQLHKTVRWYQRWTHRGGIISRYDFRPESREYFITQIHVTDTTFPHKRPGLRAASEPPKRPAAYQRQQEGHVGEKPHDRQGDRFQRRRVEKIDSSLSRLTRLPKYRALSILPICPFLSPLWSWAKIPLWPETKSKARIGPIR